MDHHDAGPPPPEPPAAASAWRLTFGYEGDEVRLLERTAVPMLAPPDELAAVPDDADGSWVEVRDGAGRALYRQVLHAPVQHEYEVFSPEPGVRPRHVPAPEVRGVFQVVVPDLADGASVAVHGPAARPEATGEASGTPARPSRKRSAPSEGRRASVAGRTLALVPLREGGDHGPH